MEPLTLIYAALSCWPPELAEAALPTVVVDSTRSSVQRSAASAPLKFPAHKVRMSCVQCVKVRKELFQRNLADPRNLIVTANHRTVTATAPARARSRARSASTRPLEPARTSAEDRGVLSGFAKIPLATSEIQVLRSGDRRPGAALHLDQSNRSPMSASPAPMPRPMPAPDMRADLKPPPPMD